MRKKYSDTLPTLKELFPDWKDEDLIFALEDSNGELEDAIVRITEGWNPSIIPVSTSLYVPSLVGFFIDISSFFS